MKLRIPSLGVAAFLAVLALSAFTTRVAAAGEQRASNRDEAVRICEPINSPSALQTRALSADYASYPVRLALAAVGSLDDGAVVVLPFSTTEQWQGRIRRIERRDDDSYSVFGVIADDHEGWFILTVDRGTVVGSVGIPGRNVWADLRNTRNDSYMLNIFDARKVGAFRCGVDAFAGRLAGDATGAAAGISHVEPAAGEPHPQLDVMVLYTRGLMNDFPKTYPNTPLDVAIQHFVDFSNQAYVNSGVNLRMRLVYRGLVDSSFGEAGHSREWLLDKLTGTSDGVLDHVHGWRSYYHADVVCLMYSFEAQALGSGGGLAHLLNAETFNTGNPANWYGSGFNVVEGLWTPSSVEPPVSGMVPTEFAHEIGHNQGLQHNCQDTSAPTDGVRTYAYGWRFVGNSGAKHVTIMSYMTGAYTNATPIPYFSNPSVSFDSQPTGNATNAGCVGTTGAQNADALSLTSDFMSRLHVNPLDPWVDFGYIGAGQNGRFATPWKSLASAVADLPLTTAAGTPDPPTITLKGPASTGPLSIKINKRMTLKADGGAVRIGGTL